MPTVNASVRQLDHSASDSAARGHHLTIDRPQAKGGQDKGPMGGEALLMGLGGCFMSNLLAAAAAREVDLQNAQVVLEGDLADAPPRYTDIRMRVSADCSPADALSKLVTIAERGCIVANTLRTSVNLMVECVA